MELSVVIPTYNRGKQLLETLNALCKQSLAPYQFEVMIVDDGSTDDTQDLVQKYLEDGKLTHWKLITLKKNSGRAAALNAGIRQSIASIILFTDDDIIPSPQWITSHLCRHRNSNRNVAVVGAVKYPDEWIKKSNLVRFHNSRYLGQNGNRLTKKIQAGDRLPLTHFAGGNCSLLKKTLLDVGMFNEKMRRGQDGELAIRLVQHGVEMVFEPMAEVVHYAEAVWSYSKWLSSFQRYYRDSVPELLSSFPDEYQSWGHWFVEQPELGKEIFSRTFAKLIFRGVARPSIGRTVAKFLEDVDSISFFYQPIFYHYVLTCAAIDAVNQRSN